MYYNSGVNWFRIPHNMHTRAGLLQETAKKSSWPVTGLQNRGPLMDPNDSKLIAYESKWFPWSSRINFIPFRIFRGPLFHKPVTGQELFFAVSYSKPALDNFDPSLQEYESVSSDLFHWNPIDLEEMRIRTEKYYIFHVPGSSRSWTFLF